MNDVRLIIDSSSNDLTNKKENLIVVPLTISFGGENYLDNDSLNISTYLEAMKENKIAGKTSCPSIDDWLTALDGAEKAIILTMTSKLSGTFSSALQSKTIYQEKHPDSQIIVVDTRSAGPEMEVILEKVRALLDSDIRWVDLDAAIAKKKTKTHLLFVLQSLHNLSLNGRVAPALAKVAKMLKINLIGMASKEGNLEPLAKVRGMKKVKHELIKQMKKLDYHGGQVIIDHCENESEARKLKDDLLAEYPEAEIIIRPMKGLCSFYAEKGGLMIGFEG